MIARLQVMDTRSDVHHYASALMTQHDRELDRDWTVTVQHAKIRMAQTSGLRFDEHLPFSGGIEAHIGYDERLLGIEGDSCCGSDRHVLHPVLLSGLLSPFGLCSTRANRMRRLAPSWHSNAHIRTLFDASIARCRATR